LLYAVTVGFENGKLVRVVLEATAGADSQINVFHYDLQGGWDPLLSNGNNPQSLADTFRDDVRPGWAAFYSSAWTIQPVVVEDEIDPQDPTAARSSWSSGSAIAGTATPSSDLLPPQCAILAKITTDAIGRRHTGRLWLGGSRSEGEQAAGVWGSTLVTGTGTFLGTIPMQPDIQEGTGVGSDVANWCVYSRTQRAQNLDPYASHVTGYVVRSLVHTLRSRALY